MCWNYVKSLSITNRLLLIFIGSTVLILTLITGLVYPPMRELLLQSRMNNEHYSFLLTQVCITKFFIALWVSTLVIIISSYLLAKRSMRPIEQFTNELASISVSSLGKRLSNEGNPKELKEIALTCNDLLSRIENSFDQMKQFSASMAHELRTPIHYLQTATEITLAKTQSVEIYQNLLHTHLEEYQNLTQLIDNLLFLTRSEQGLLPLNIKTVSGKQLICSVIDYFQSIAQDKGIELQVFGDAQIEVDEQLFKRVISNLLDNSLAYSKALGKIQIYIESVPLEPIKISIKDNGIGISKEHLPLLGQGFYRVNHNLDRENAGLGLGLAIAKSIMEQHKGHLVIDSQLGVGTCVLLILN